MKRFFYDFGRALRVLIASAVVCAAAVACVDTKLPDDGDDSGDDNSGSGGNTEQTKPVSSNERVNREVIDAQLDTLYLWNEAYRRTTRDFKQAYDDYLTDVLGQMHYKGENLQDGYASGSYWYFYTYITREKAGSSTRASYYDKELWHGYGLYLVPVYADEGRSRLYLVPLWVYPGSPADKAGIARGDIISKIDGVNITENTLSMSFADIYYDEFDSRETHTFTLIDLESNGSTTEVATLSLDTANYYPTPILFTQTYDIRGHRIGYLVYNGFESPYDDDLLAVLDGFAAEGITDIIIDLRYNGGGDVDTCRKLASVLGGSACEGKIFEYTRYNDERMAMRHCDPADHTTYPKRPFDSELAVRCNFPFGRIHLICTSNTASASELLINSLRGVDVTVEVVASEYTNGKDVGMEVYFPQKPYSGYYYTLAPISFQNYNAKGESDFDNGFPPTVEVLPDESGRTYEDYIPYNWGFPVDWGMELDAERTMPMFDYVADAVYDIVGGDYKVGELEIADGVQTGGPATRSRTAELHRVPMQRVEIGVATRSGEQPSHRDNPLKKNMFRIAGQN